MPIRKRENRKKSWICNWAENHANNTAATVHKYIHNIYYVLDNSDDNYGINIIMQNTFLAQKLLRIDPHVCRVVYTAE